MITDRAASRGGWRTRDWVVALFLAVGLIGGGYRLAWVARGHLDTIDAQVEQIAINEHWQASPYDPTFTADDVPFMGPDRHMWASRHDLGLWLEVAGLGVAVSAVVIAIQVSRQRRNDG